MRRPCAPVSVKRGSARSLTRLPRADSGPVDFGEQCWLGCGGAKPIHVESIVSSGEQWLARQPSDVLAIRGRQLGDRSGALRFGETVLSAGHPHARGKPAQVPFPPTRVCFIEIVEVDDQVQLGRGVEAEVAEMSVAANDRLDAGGGQPGEVFGHDHCGAAQEAVRGSGHPGNSDRDEPFESSLVGVDDLGNDVRPPGGGIQSPNDERGTSWRKRRPRANRSARELGRVRSDAKPAGSGNTPLRSAESPLIGGWSRSSDVPVVELRVFRVAGTL